MMWKDEGRQISSKRKSEIKSINLTNRVRVRTLLQNLELNPPTGNIDDVLTRRWRRGGVDDDEVQISLSWLLKLPEISSST